MKDFERIKGFYKTRLGIAEHREFEILKTALILIQSRGFEELTFTELAKRTKLSRPAVHYYFKSKSELAERLLLLTTYDLQRFVEKKLESAKTAKLKTSALQVYCEATLDWIVLRPSEAAVFLTMLQVCSRDSLLRKQNNSLAALGKQKIISLLLEVSPKGNLEERATRIQSTLTGACFKLVTEEHSAKESTAFRANCVRACIELAESKQLALFFQC